jgi:hypothetical protein
LIDWCLTPTLAVFQLYRGITKLSIICCDIINIYLLYLHQGSLISIGCRPRLVRLSDTFITDYRNDIVNYRLIIFIDNYLIVCYMRGFLV